MTTPEIKRAIADAYKRGDRIGDICDRFGVSYKTIKNVRAEFGIAARTTGNKRIVERRHVEQYARLIKSGRPRTEAAKVVGLNKDTIERHAHDLGVDLNPINARPDWVRRARLMYNYNQ